MKKLKDFKAGKENDNETKREKAGKKIKNFEELISKRRKKNVYLFVALLCVLLAAVFIYFGKIKELIAVYSAIVLLFAYFVSRKRFKRYADIKKMEDAFPDFISLMASNLRAGMTIDRALLLSARKEFSPLDEEISALGKDILTGKEISEAMAEMADRIGSDDIRKTVLLIVSGIRSGGNLSVLLEHVSESTRERIFVRKKAASNVLMYQIFIFFAVAAGAPFLFGLSSVLVEVLTSILKDIPFEQISNANMPFTLTTINISVSFILYFSTFFVIATSILSSLVLGLVSKGKEREGIKYIVPMMVVSLLVFFLSRILLLRYFADFAS